MVCASEYGGIRVYLGDGAGTNWAQSSAEGLPSARDPALEHAVGWVNQVRLIDINNDGHLDIVASYYEGPRVCWRREGEVASFIKGLPIRHFIGLTAALPWGMLTGTARWILSPLTS